MSEAFYLGVINIAWQLGARLHGGPPLQEFEFCAYQQACRTIEAICRANADWLDKQHEKEQEQAESGE